MRTRLISGILGGIILIFIMGQPPAVMGVTVSVISIVALYEFYQSVRKVNFYPVQEVGFFSCIMFLLYIMYYSFDINLTQTAIGGLYQVLFQRNMIYFIIYLVIVYLMINLVFRGDRFKLDDIAVTLLGIIYVPFLLSFIFMVRLLENGFEMAWLVLIGTFSTDTFAYFVGKLFGKTKLLPEISPNKTIAGAIGGIGGSILCTTAFGVLYANTFAGMNVFYLHYILIGLLCGVIAQVGDWAASAIKRSVGIKDFGHIMPGHGGILDRVDSLLFVAPAVYFYLQIIL